MKKFHSIAAVLLSLLLSEIVFAEPAMSRLSQHGRWLTDQQGRVVMLRGGNLPLPSYTSKKSAYSANTPQLLADNGFNAVRLVIFFSELMPEPGHINADYLKEIDNAVAAYRNVGIYVLIDFHQDEYSAAIGVRGFPAWAVFTDGHEPKRLRFPAGYFSDPAIHAAFDNFWKNREVPNTDRGVQDFYSDGLAAVAKHFRDNPAVFGIDVMNEPFTGSRCNQPDPRSADCPELERDALAPFYEKAGRAIAAVAPAIIVFVEPFMLQGSMGVPINTPPPGAPAQRGLSFHQYGTLAEIRQRGNDYAIANAQRTQSAILNTEWGFTNDPIEWRKQAQELDDLLIPWLAWARGAFAPLVDPQLPAAGNENREAVLRELARPYPRATAGTPQRLTFEPETGALMFTYTSAAVQDYPRRVALTEIVLPKANFPQGYSVTIDSGKATIISKPDARVLIVRAQPDAGEITIRAQRKGKLADLPAPTASEDPYAFLQQPSATKSKSDVLSSNSMLGDLLGNPAARAILDREVPELVNSPQVGMGSQMSLRALQAYVPQMLNDEKLNRIDRALSAIPKGTDH